MATMKKSKASEENAKDRLSDLPDSLIHHILSSLNTKNAVQTCVLSKRWNHLWTYLSSLDFDSKSFGDLTSFKKFVLYVLSRREPSNLHTLKFYSRSLDKTFVGRVICYAVSHSVQEICMDNAPPPTYELLSSISLRSFHLELCSLYDDHFSRCLNLENLILNRCHISGGEVIKISAPRLVMVNMSRVDFGMYPYPYELVVSSPRLSSFCYQGICPSTFSMDGCPFLDRVDFRLCVLHMEKQEVFSALKNILQEVILRAKILTMIWKKGFMVKTVLRDEGGVHAVIYNEATNKIRKVLWRGTNENFELLLGWILQRCED